MRTQCQAQSSMNSWDMLLLQSTTRQRLHYLLIDDVVAQDADGILQFLVASPPPPPIVAGHHFREDLTHGVVRLLQRSRLGVQAVVKIITLSGLSYELLKDLPVVFVDIVAKVQEIIVEESVRYKDLILFRLVLMILTPGKLT